ncbi:MAG: sodium:solute symporter family protein [Candidatus Bipolaricaulaceae bacterium]
MSVFWLGFALLTYMFLGFAVAWAARRGIGQSLADFFLANRTLGGLVNALSYSATTYSAFMMVGLAGLTYQAGVGALGFEFIYLSGLVLAAFFGPRFWLAAGERGYISPAEMLGDRYESKTVTILAALASLVFLIPYTSVQLMGIAYLLQGLSRGMIPYFAGVVWATFLALAWARIGGLRSVAWTDALQALVMLVSSGLLVFFVVIRGIGGFPELFRRLEQDYPQWLSVPGPGYFQLPTFLGLSLPWFFFCISNPQVSQRLFVPRSLSALRRMLRGFLLFGFVYTLISVTWGLCARVLLADLPKADLATPTLLASPFVPGALAILALLGIVSAAISTMDSVLLTLSSMFARDVYGVLRPKSSEARQLAVGKWVIPVISGAAMIFAFFQLDLIAILAVSSSAGLLVLVPATVGAFFWKRGTAKGAAASILGPGLLVIGLQASNAKPLGLWPGVWALLASTLIFVGVSLATTPPKNGPAFVDRINALLAEKSAL